MNANAIDPDLVCVWADGSVWLEESGALSDAQNRALDMAIVAEQKRRSKAGLETRFVLRFRRSGDRIVNGPAAVATVTTEEERAA